MSSMTLYINGREEVRIASSAQTKEEQRVEFISLMEDYAKDSDGELPFSADAIEWTCNGWQWTDPNGSVWSLEDY